MNANSGIKATTGISVSVVALIAAIISYGHIYHVAVEHGQSPLDARLLPFSVDGLIAAASLVLFYASRNRLSAPGLARGMLALGVGATIAANAIYGVSHGWLGIILSAWPAIAFIGAAELTIWMVRAATSIRPSARYSRANEVRTWARFNGYDIPDRGRIPDEITRAFHAASNGKAESVNGAAVSDAS